MLILSLFLPFTGYPSTYSTVSVTCSYSVTPVQSGKSKKMVQILNLFQFQYPNAKTSKLFKQLIGTSKVTSLNVPKITHIIKNRTISLLVTLSNFPYKIL